MAPRIAAPTATAYERSLSNGLSRRDGLGVLAAALGYFVDAYDLVLYNIVRIQSLQGLGLRGNAVLETGVDLLNAQLAGLLLGGFWWGIWGDKLGRRSVLFGSILCYSLGTLANAFVGSVEAYAACRFIAGLGLAGELGAGVTLVVELLPAKSRGYATMLVAAVGVLGVCVASLVGDRIEWRAAYVVGGLLGLSLLALRLGVGESNLFESARRSALPRGSVLYFARSVERLRRYACLVLVAIPIWFAIGVIVTFSTELGPALGLTEAPTAAHAVLAYYLGLTLGDLTTGTLSQRFQTRRGAIGAFLVLFALCLGGYPALGGQGLGAYYACLFALGFASGYWAVFITLAAELFGTNVRALVAITAPNVVRGLAIPFTLVFKAYAPGFGAVPVAMGLGALALGLGAVALFALPETYGKEMDFYEE